MDGHLIIENAVEQTGSAVDSASLLYRAVETARLAPSGHNMQPWRFRLHADHIDLFADRTRALPALDPDNRELVISCGAALFYLRLSLRRDGMGEHTEILPDANQPDLLAQVWATWPQNHNFEYARLFASVSERRTNRMSFHPRPLPEGFPEELVRAADQEGARLYLIPEAARLPLIDLITDGARALAGSQDFRKEVTTWLGEPSTGFMSETGVTNFPVEVGRHLTYAGGLSSPLNVGNLLAAHESRLAREAPLLTVLGTAADGVTAWLAAGQALAHVLLHAAAEGVMASFLDAPIQVASMRPCVVSLLPEPAHPHVILGFGYAPYGRKTLRRPLESLLIKG